MLRLDILRWIMLVSLVYHGQITSLWSQCTTLSGNTWTEPQINTPDRTYSLTQDASGVISGTTYKSICSVQTWPVSGQFRSDGTFTITVNNPGSDPEDPCIATWYTITGTINAPNCDTMSGTWTNSLPNSGNVTWNKACDVPSGETTTANGWGDNSPRGYYPTLALFWQSLYGSVNFGGREVNETFPSQGEDTCYFSGSPYGPYFVPPSWAQWTVGWLDFSPGPTNSWGYDYIGWNPEAISYYRSTRPAMGLPSQCGVQWQQRMNISCSAGANFYQGNFVAASMDATSLTSNRASAFDFRNWR